MDEMYDGFGSLDGSSPSQRSSVLSPQSVTSIQSKVSDSRTFVRPASSMASARCIHSARPPTSLDSMRRPITAFRSIASSSRASLLPGEVTSEQDYQTVVKAIEDALLDNISLVANGEAEKALDKAKEAARLCNRIQHRALSSQHLDHRVTCPDTLVFKVTHQYGVTLALAGKFRQAEKIFLNLLRQSSDHEGYQPTVNASLATLYQENGDFSHALQIWLTLFDDNAFPPGAERNFLIAQLTICYVALARYDLAYKYNEIIAETNDNHEAAFHRLLLLIKKEASREKIEDTYRKLLRVCCSHCSALSENSDMCAEMVKNSSELMLSVGSSIEWIENQLMDSSWQRVSTEMELRRCFDLLEEGQISQVLEKVADFDCLDLSGDLLCKVSTMLCWIYFQLGHFEQCLEHANKGYEANKRDSAALLNLGCAHFALENYDCAFQCFGTTSNEPSVFSEQRLLYKGLALKALRRHDEALSVFLSLSQPWTSETALEISEMQSLQGDTTEALQTLINVRTEDEDSVALLTRIGSLAAILGDDDTAAWHYSQAHRLDPTDPVVIDYLARYSVEKNVPEKAVELYGKACRIEPDKAKWQVLMATAMRRTGNSTEAFDLCLKTHDNHPEDISCLQLLLNLCRKLQIPAHQVLQYRAKLDVLQERQRQAEEAHDVSGDLHRSPTPSVFSRMSLARPGSCMSLRPVSPVSSVNTARTFPATNGNSNCSKSVVDGPKSSTVNSNTRNEELELSIDDLLPPLR